MNRRNVLAAAAACVVLFTSSCAVFDRDLRDGEACQGLADITGGSTAALLTMVGTPGLSEAITQEALPSASARLGRDLHTFARLHQQVEDGSVVPSPSLYRQIERAANDISLRCQELEAMGLLPAQTSHTGNDPASPESNPTDSRSSTGDVTGSTTAQDGDFSSSLTELRLEPENRAGYERELFEHWIDEDGDGCDTRQEVLIRDSITPVTVGPDCQLSGGQWISSYDGFTSSDPSDFDIDHLVPLAESWDSGASRWTEAERREFANDLDLDEALQVVSATSNRSKSDQDPADWLPTDPEIRCEYARAWISVKSKWDLSVDENELSTLETLATCQ